MRWPNLFIVGAPRAGTTSLHEYLNQIPDIYMSIKKEPSYFALDNCYTRYVHTIPKNDSEYLKLFIPGKSKKYIGESSTIYLSNKHTPERIHSKSPNAKIIILLRDPIERAFSHYFHHFEMDFKSIKPTFDEQVNLELTRGTDLNEFDIRLEFGLYFNDVKRYITQFGEKNVKIIIFENFVKNVKETLFELCNFLDVIPKENLKIEKIYNPSLAPRGQFSRKILHSKTISIITKYLIPRSSKIFLRKKLIINNKQNQKMSIETRFVLKKYYQEDVKQLEEFLNMKLPWKNFSDNYISS